MTVALESPERETFETTVFRTCRPVRRHRTETGRLIRRTLRRRLVLRRWVGS
jgi:hypothetical protein